MKFCWTTMHVKDMENSLKFYTEIVGLEIQRRYKPVPEMELAFLGKGETQIELICDSRIKETDPGKDISVGFDAGSLDEIMKKLKESGIPVTAGPFQPNPAIKFFYVADPDGLKVQFIEFIK